MSATIINNSKSNVQVYAMCSDKIGTVNLKDIFSGDLTFIGDGSNADITVLNNCSGKKYIIIQVWGDNDSRAVNTVAVYDIAAKQIIANELRSFTINMSTDPSGLVTIIINDNPSSIWRFILIGLGILLLIALLVLIGYWAMRYLQRRGSLDSSVYSNQDIPILVN